MCECGECSWPNYMISIYYWGYVYWMGKRYIGVGYVDMVTFNDIRARIFSLSPPCLTTHAYPEAKRTNGIAGRRPPFYASIAQSGICKICIRNFIIMWWWFVFIANCYTIIATPLNSTMWIPHRYDSMLQLMLIVQVVHTTTPSYYYSDTGGCGPNRIAEHMIGSIMLHVHYRIVPLEVDYYGMWQCLRWRCEQYMSQNKTKGTCNVEKICILCQLNHLISIHSKIFPKVHHHHRHLVNRHRCFVPVCVDYYLTKSLVSVAVDYSDLYYCPVQLNRCRPMYRRLHQPANPSNLWQLSILYRSIDSKWMSTKHLSMTVATQHPTVTTDKNWECRNKKSESHWTPLNRMKLPEIFGRRNFRSNSHEIIRVVCILLEISLVFVASVADEICKFCNHIRENVTNFLVRIVLELQNSKILKWSLWTMLKSNQQITSWFGSGAP